MGENIAASKVHRKYLKSNSTSHPWAFGAFAELIDNSYDAKAREVQINLVTIEDETCLTFQDDGNGMDKDQLYKMLSFGFCERVLSTAIGHYGNGFKSSSMRLGKDAVVFTRTKDTAGVGFLSRTYNKAINADSVKVPMLNYTYSNLKYKKEGEDHDTNLTAILDHSPFNEEDKLIKELRMLPKTGTRVIIFNLKRNDGNLEFDLHTDPEDIICGEAFQSYATNVSKYRSSLREYCSILYLKPRMKIMLRGKYVKIKFVEKSLSNAFTDEYTPKQAKNSTKITFGFVPLSEQSEDCGMMLYVENRLIKPYEPVSCQKQGKGIGAHVVGVTQAKYLTPTQNKQDFNRDDAYHKAMVAFNQKLKIYWESMQDAPPTHSRDKPDSIWVQCEYKECMKWRRLPQGTSSSSLPAKWYCYLHPNQISCSFPEETHEEDEEIIQPLARSKGKRKASTKLATLLNGKRGRQKSIETYMNSTSVEESTDNESTTSCSFLLTPDMPSTSSARKPAHKKGPVKSGSQFSGIASISSSGETCPINDEEGAIKTVATSVSRKNNHRQSNYRRAVSTEIPINLRQRSHNARTSTYIDQQTHDNTNTSLDISQTLGDISETLGDISGTLGDISDVSNSIDQEPSENSETSHNSCQRADDLSLSSTDTKHKITENSLIELKNQEIAALKDRLSELTERFDALLKNSKQLLAIMAPDVPLSDDVDIEDLIVRMIETQLNSETD